MFGCITVNTHIQNFNISPLFYFFQQEEMTPYSLLTVRIIRLKNAHQADFCKYQILFLTLHHPQITLLAPACARYYTNAKQDITGEANLCHRTSICNFRGLFGYWGVFRIIYLTSCLFQELENILTPVLTQRCLYNMSMTNA